MPKVFFSKNALTLNVRCDDIYKGTCAKCGGIIALWQITLAYAKYLSPELHMQVNEIYLRFKSGEVTLASVKRHAG